MRYVVCALALLLCGMAAKAQEPTVDAGAVSDAGVLITAYPDAKGGIPDGAPPAGTVVVYGPDAGSPVAPAPDAGSPTVPVTDAGVPDAGADVPDAGVADAGADAEDVPDVLVAADAGNAVTPDAEGPEVVAPPAAPVALPPPSGDTTGPQAVGLLVQALQKKQWAVAIGLVVMLLVWGLRKANVLKSVPAKAMPWVAMVMSLVGAFGMAASSGVPLSDALNQGVMSGMSAVALWELAFKHIAVPSDPPPSA